MSSRKQTTTTETPTTEAAVVVQKSASVWVIVLVLGILFVILICLIVCFIIYRKQKTKAGKIQPSISTEKLNLKRDSIESASFSSKQRVFSVDSEKGEGADNDANDAEHGEKKHEEQRHLSRASSRSSFKAVATVARMGARVGAVGQPIDSVSARVQNAADEDGHDESEDDEETGDSGYGEGPAKGKSKSGVSPILAAFTAGPKQKQARKQSIKQKIENTTTQVFTAAKELYGKGQSTYKRTGGRQNSAGVQTSPTGSVISIPGLVETPDPLPESFYERSDKERCYFVYLISDSAGSCFRKDCIGRVALPDGVKQVTLADLRILLAKSDDPTLKSMLRNNKSFRFVTETYKFVAQGEQAAGIDDIYANQGIFVKFQEGADVKLTQREGPSPALSTRIKSRQRARRRSGRRGRGVRHVAKDSSTDQEELPPLRDQSRPLGQPSYRSKPQGEEGSRVSPSETQQHKFMPINSSNGEPSQSLPSNRTPIRGGRDSHHDHQLIRERSDSSDVDHEDISERLHRRHIECISPLPVKYKEAYKRQVLLILNSRRMCDNKGCRNHALFKCAKCTMSAYCSVKCKKDHYLDHRMICKRPPWRL